MKEHTFLNPYESLTKPLAISSSTTISLIPTINNRHNIAYRSKPNSNKFHSNYYCDCNFNNSNGLPAIAAKSSTTNTTEVEGDTDDSVTKFDTKQDSTILSIEDTIDSEVSKSDPDKHCVNQSSTVPLIWHNNFSLFHQQQQFAFFPNASEKVMANTRRIIVLSIYASSLVDISILKEVFNLKFLQNWF